MKTVSLDEAILNVVSLCTSNPHMDREKMLRMARALFKASEDGKFVSRCECSFSIVSSEIPFKMSWPSRLTKEDVIDIFEFIEVQKRVISRQVAIEQAIAEGKDEVEVAQ